MLHTASPTLLPSRLDQLVVMPHVVVRPQNLDRMGSRKSRQLLHVDEILRLHLVHVQNLHAKLDVEEPGQGQAWTPAVVATGLAAEEEFAGQAQGSASTQFSSPHRLEQPLRIWTTQVR